MLGFPKGKACLNLENMYFQKYDGDSLSFQYNIAIVYSIIVLAFLPKEPSETNTSIQIHFLKIKSC